MQLYSWNDKLSEHIEGFKSFLQTCKDLGIYNIEHAVLHCVGSQFKFRLSWPHGPGQKSFHQDEPPNRTTSDALVTSPSIIKNWTTVILFSYTHTITAADKGKLRGNHNIGILSQRTCKRSI